MKLYNKKKRILLSLLIIERFNNLIFPPHISFLLSSKERVMQKINFPSSSRISINKSKSTNNINRNNKSITTNNKAIINSKTNNCNRNYFLKNKNLIPKTPNQNKQAKKQNKLIIKYLQITSRRKNVI